MKWRSPARRRQAYANALSHPGAAEMLKDLYSEHCDKLSYAANRTPEEVAYREGQRSVVMKLIHRSEINPLRLSQELERERQDT